MTPADQRRRSAARARKDRAFRWLCVAVTLASVGVLAVLLVSIGVHGWRHLDLDFLSSGPSRRPESAGLRVALWGSVWLCAVAAFAAVPLGVATAIALEEFKPGGWASRVHSFVQLNVTNLAGVPSIVYGILGLTVFVRCFDLFGPPNMASYDEMRLVRPVAGDPYLADLVETIDPDEMVSGDETLSLMSPRSGPVSVARASLRSATKVYVRDHHFLLADGSVVSGDIQSMDAAEVVVVAGDGSGALVERRLARADITGHNADLLPQIGDPDGVFYLRVPMGASVLAGGLTLALVILPIVIISSREAIRAVPDSLREGSFALGATKWQMIRRVVLPSAVPGIMTGSILAMSRAIGEAAPLLVVGGVLFLTFTPRNPMSDFASMPLQIYNWAGRPQADFHDVAASGIIVLLGVLLAFNLFAIVIRQMFQRQAT